MSSWISIFYYSMFGAALLLSVMGVLLTAVIPGLDRFNKRFFLCYFIVFMVCCLSTMLETIPLFFTISNAAFYAILIVESVLLSLPLPMLTVYINHFRGVSPQKSRLMWFAAGFWAVYIIIVFTSPFFGGFTHVTPDNHYYRGPLYPIALLPMMGILLLNLAGTIRSRRQLSRKVFLAFLAAILPMTLALTVQMFVDVFPLLDIAYVASALSMYGLILSDQIDQNRRQQQKIADQHARIMVLQMRPHYIYNTLMTIYSLCNQDPKKARQVTADFTNYLRRNFNAVASENTIPFSAELEHTRAYLAVEQAQYEDMLVVEYDTPFIGFRLPPLTLQPIVENAVKHGMDPYAGPLHVSVRTLKTDKGCVITVEDNGKGFDPSDTSKPHPTIDNIRERLAMMSGGSMEIVTPENGGTRVTIRVPFRKTE